MIEYLKRLETISTLVFQLIKIGIGTFKYIRDSFENDTEKPTDTPEGEELQNSEIRKSIEHKEIHIEKSSNSLKITFIHDAEHLNPNNKEEYPYKNTNVSNQIQLLQDLCHSNLYSILEQHDICNNIAGDDHPLVL